MAAAFVAERAAGGASASLNIWPVTVASNCGAGNLLILSVAFRIAGATLASVIDSRGNIWTVDVSLNNTGNVVVGIASTLQGVGTLQSGDTVTATISGGLLSTCIGYLIEEFSGIAASPVDKTASDFNAAAVGSGDTGTTAATSQASELAYGAVATGGASGAFTWGSYTPVTSNRGSSGASTTDRQVGAAYKILSATGTQGDTFTYPGSASGYAAGVVTYKATAAAATDTGAFLQFM